MEREVKSVTARVDKPENSSQYKSIKAVDVLCRRFRFVFDVCAPTFRQNLLVVDSTQNPFQLIDG